jgi:Sulfotransferase family
MGQLFILGNPRSGTSLLRLMLTCHPNIIIPPESHFFLWLERQYSSWKMGDNLDEFLVDLYNATKFETWKIPKDKLEIRLKERNVSSFAELIEEIYLFYGELQKKENIKVWGDKNKLWKEKLGLYQQYYPEAKFIHLVRDGRDIACSYKELHKNKSESKYAPNLPSEIEDIANIWSLNVSTISNFFESISPNNTLIVSYENLVKDTIETLTKISEFLKLPNSSMMMDYLNENNDSLFEPKEFLQWKSKLNQNPDKKNIGKYLEILTNNEINIFENIASLELNKFGYE